MGEYEEAACVKLAAAVCHLAIKDWRPLRRYYLARGRYTETANELIAFFNSDLFDCLLGNISESAIVREKLKIPKLAL
jgi:hypothetical protein